MLRAMRALAIDRGMRECPVGESGAQLPVDMLALCHCSQYRSGHQAYYFHQIALQSVR